MMTVLVLDGEFEGVDSLRLCNLDREDAREGGSLGSGIITNYQVVELDYGIDMK